MLYIHFFTNVTDPKNGFKAVVSIGKISPFFMAVIIEVTSNNISVSTNIDFHRTRIC